MSQVAKKLSAIIMSLENNHNMSVEKLQEMTSVLQQAALCVIEIEKKMSLEIIECKSLADEAVKENEQLMSENEQLKKENEDLSTKNASIAILEEKNLELAKENAELKSTIAERDANVVVGDGNDELKVSIAENEKLRCEIDAMIKENEDLKFRREETYKWNAEVEKTMDEREAKYTKLEGDLREFTRKNERLTKEVKELTEEVKDLEATNRLLRSDISDMTAKGDEYEEEIAKLKPEAYITSNDDKMKGRKNDDNAEDIEMNKKLWLGFSKLANEFGFVLSQNAIEPKVESKAAKKLPKKVDEQSIVSEAPIKSEAKKVVNVPTKKNNDSDIFGFAVKKADKSKKANLDDVPEQIVEQIKPAEETPKKKFKDVGNSLLLESCAEREQEEKKNADEHYKNLARAARAKKEQTKPKEEVVEDQSEESCDISDTGSESGSVSGSVSDASSVTSTKKPTKKPVASTKKPVASTKKSVDSTVNQDTPKIRCTETTRRALIAEFIDENGYGMDSKEFIQKMLAISPHKSKLANDLKKKREDQFIEEWRIQVKARTAAMKKV